MDDIPFVIRAVGAGGQGNNAVICGNIHPGIILGLGDNHIQIIPIRLIIGKLIGIRFPIGIPIVSGQIKGKDLIFHISFFRRI